LRADEDIVEVAFIDRDEIRSPRWDHRSERRRRCQPTAAVASVSVPRNAPCPCGSGLKYKKCHGLTRDQERALVTRLEALTDARELPRMFPSLRIAEAGVVAFTERAAGLLDDAEPFLTRCSRRRPR